MKISFRSLPLIVVLLFVITGVAFLSGCNKPQPYRPDFTHVLGVTYTEVRRAFDTGYSFSKNGFQQKPEWILAFLGNDSAKIYSPREHKFIEYPMYYSHDSVYNFAREWLRIKKLTRDSLVLQLLQVRDKVIQPEVSNVYMTFYSDSLLKARHADVEKMKLPTRADTLYIRWKSAQANRNPESRESVFSATEPVSFRSRTPAITVTAKQFVKDIVEDTRPSDSYMYPEYRVEIRGAYDNFVFPFSVSVDHRGTIRFAENLGMTEDPEGRVRVLKAIIKGYLQQYLDVTPGKTLGIPHTTRVKITVKGIK